VLGFDSNVPDCVSVVTALVDSMMRRIRLLSPTSKYCPLGSMVIAEEMDENEAEVPMPSLLDMDMLKPATVVT
jgi:hypothetical protein